MQVEQVRDILDSHMTSMQKIESDADRLAAQVEEVCERLKHAAPANAGGCTSCMLCLCSRATTKRVDSCACLIPCLVQLASKPKAITGGEHRGCMCVYARRGDSEFRISPSFRQF